MKRITGLGMLSLICLDALAQGADSVNVNAQATVAHTSHFGLWFVVVLEGLLLAVILAFIWYCSAEYIKQIVCKSGRLEHKMNQLANNATDILLKKTEAELQTLEQRLRALEDTLGKLQNEQREMGHRLYQSQQFREEAPVKFSSLLFASSINKDDLTFYAVSPQSNTDTIFELRLKTAGMAEFSVFQGASTKVIKRMDFLEGCDVQKLGSQNVLTDTKGEAQKLSDGKWKVITPAKIKIT
jgi:hypothetical protein